MGESVLVLRSCYPNMTSHNGFVWPESGYVEAPDWSPAPICGGGLHGWLWGEGQWNVGYWGDETKWLVVRVDSKDIVNLGNKVKFKSGEVVFCGTRFEATNYIHRAAPEKIVLGASVAAGIKETASVGPWGMAMSGDKGCAFSQFSGMSMVGEYGVAIAGDSGMAIAADGGTAITGAYGMAIAGTGGIVSAGPLGVIALKRLNYFQHEIGYEIVSASIGVNGIKPRTKYSLDFGGNFKKVIEEVMVVEQTQFDLENPLKTLEALYARYEFRLESEINKEEDKGPKYWIVAVSVIRSYIEFDDFDIVTRSDFLKSTINPVKEKIKCFGVADGYLAKVEVKGDFLIFYYNQ